ncbi:MAG: hypothetical protein SGARI_003785 [Bacillariaceae sp.]
MCLGAIILVATSPNTKTASKSNTNELGMLETAPSRRLSPITASIINWDLDSWLPTEDADDAAQRLAIPSLTQPFYNNVVDVHSTMSAKDTELIFSTNGNWHLALRRLLDEQYFPTHPSVKRSNLLTTSPPISVAQMETGRVKVGNILYEDAQPHVVVAPGRVLAALEDAGKVDGSRIPIIRTYGNVILKRRGDNRFKDFWDLKKVRPGRFASSDPAEGGSFNNYRNSVLNIALNNPRNPNFQESKIQDEAESLQASLFDTDEGVATIGPPMHRSVPHLVAVGEADAGLFFLHLAVTAMKENPGVFTAVFLGDALGTTATETDDWEVLAMGQAPLTGNQVGTFAAVKTTTLQNAAQTTAVDDFLSALQSSEFTTILVESGLRRPE